MNHYQKTLLWAYISTLLVFGPSCSTLTESPETGIRINRENPFYWEYNGTPVLLIGGTMNDNLFQNEDMRAHLELLESVGGNYIRCTMSSRDEGDEKPYLMNEEGIYNLENFNLAYWDKLNDLLTLCRDLDIIVQIEVWATYDFYWGDASWANNPFNPKLNSNYTAESSHLPEEITLPAQSEVNPFFRTIPGLDDNEVVLAFQKQFVDKLLSISLDYNNVLYSIDNETTAHYDWGKYWSKYLHTIARERGKNIDVTEMWDCWDPTGGEVEDALVQEPELGGWFAEYQNPEIHQTANVSFTLNDTVSYQFLDVSNNNSQKGETHYKTALWVRNAINRSGHIRPINNVKIYGGDRDQIWSGNHQDGMERFWRDVFAGHAAVRFHRPPTGIGLNDEAQHQIKSLRMLSNQMDFFHLVPMNELFLDRQDNEAFCLANPDHSEIAIYFPARGEVSVQGIKGEYSVRRIRNSEAIMEEFGQMSFPGSISNTENEDCAYILSVQED